MALFGAAPVQFVAVAMSSSLEYIIDMRSALSHFPLNRGTQ